MKIWGWLISTLIDWFLSVPEEDFRQWFEEKKRLLFGDLQQSVHCVFQPWENLHFQQFQCDLRVWLFMTWNKFWPKKDILTQHNVFIFFFLDVCSITRFVYHHHWTITKSDQKMHFSGPSQWNKIRFEYQGIIFNEKKS